MTFCVFCVCSEIPVDERLTCGHVFVSVYDALCKLDLPTPSRSGPCPSFQPNITKLACDNKKYIVFAVSRLQSPEVVNMTTNGGILAGLNTWPSRSCVARSLHARTCRAPHAAVVMPQRKFLILASILVLLRPSRSSEHVRADFFMLQILMLLLLIVRSRENHEI